MLSLAILAVRMGNASSVSATIRFPQVCAFQTRISSADSLRFPSSNCANIKHKYCLLHGKQDRNDGGVLDDHVLVAAVQSLHPLFCPGRQALVVQFGSPLSHAVSDWDSQCIQWTYMACELCEVHSANHRPFAIASLPGKKSSFLKLIACVKKLHMWIWR